MSVLLARFATEAWYSRTTAGVHSSNPTVRPSSTHSSPAAGQASARNSELRELRPSSMIAEIMRGSRPCRAGYLLLRAVDAPRGGRPCPSPRLLTGRREKCNARARRRAVWTSRGGCDGLVAGKIAAREPALIFVQRQRFRDAE